MHEAKGLAAFFAPIQTYSKVCGALCVPELPRLLLQCGKEQRCFDGRAGQQHIEEALHCSWQLPPWPCQRRHYPVEGVKSLASCGQKLYILVSVSNASVYQGTQLATGNSYVMIPCWTKANAGDEYSSWHRSDVLTPLQAAVTRISPLQVSDWCQPSSLGLICENVPWLVYVLHGTSETKVLWFLVLNIIT